MWHVKKWTKCALARLSSMGWAGLDFHDPDTKIKPPLRVQGLGLNIPWNRIRIRGRRLSGSASLMSQQPSLTLVNTGLKFTWGRAERNRSCPDDKMKIRRSIKRNLLLKIKQVKFFPGKTVTMGTSTTKCVSLVSSLLNCCLLPYILSFSLS